MTEGTTMPAEREAIVKGKINVGTYSDGSGPVAEVSWNRGAEHCPNCVWIETGSSNWLAVDVEHVEELCRAIRTAARHIKESTHE